MTTLRRPAVAAVLLSACASAYAQTVSVDFAQVPLRQALAELQRRTGASIESPPDSAASRPVTLRADNAPLRGVLRAVCAQAGAHCEQADRRNFRILEGPDPGERCPTVQAGPYTIRIRSVTITDALDLTYERSDQAPLAFQDQMTIALTIEADADLDTEAVIGMDRGVAARDDVGRIVAARATGLPEGYYDPQGSGYARDGVVSEVLTLDVPGPGATRLTVLEGDLVVHDAVRDVTFEFPLAGPGLPQSAEGHTFAIQGVRPNADDGYYHVDTQWRLPWSPRGEPWSDAYLVAPDGRRLTFSGASGRLGRQEQDFVIERSYRVRLPADFVPEKLVFECTAKSRETHRVRFRFQDISLPPREG
jgi:hypothetical protein